MSFLASWKTALRIAWREARRSKGRSALVVAMIALPVLCLSFAAVMYDMATLTGAERADQTMGTADARVQWSHRESIEQDIYGENYGSVAATAPPVNGNKEPAPPPTTEELVAKLPPGSTMLPVRRGTVHLRTAAGTGRPNAASLDAASPLAAGFVTVLDGRAPRSATEVALTEQAAQRLGQGLGGTVTSADGLRTYSVVGLVEFPSSLEQWVLFAPITEADPTGIVLNSTSWFVATPAPITWDDVREFNKSGIVVASREVYLNPPPAAQTPDPYGSTLQVEELAVGVLIFGLGLLEVVLLAGPAFAVSARRRQRQLALVAANGGTAAHIRRIVLADGVVLGAIGAVVGIGIGIIAAFAARTPIEELLVHARLGGYRIFPTALAAIATLAVVTGLLAALVPAFITARQNVIASLAGRRGVTRSRKRWIIVGLAMIALGSATVLLGTYITTAQVMLGGLILGELGLVLCTPALVGLIAKLGRVLPLAPRIALRDAARNRAAAAPAISAVMAAVAGSVAIGLYIDSERAMFESQWSASLPMGTVTAYLGDDGNPDTPAQDPAMIETVLRANLPITDVHRVGDVTCQPVTPDTAGGTPSTGPATPDDPSQKDRWCALEAKTAPQHLCPFEAMLSERQPTKAEARAANADPRCTNIYRYNHQVTVTDGSALATLTGAASTEVTKAAAVLRAGGVVVSDAALVGDDDTITINVINIDHTMIGNNGRVVDRVGTPVHLPAYLLSSGPSAMGVIISPDTLARLGLGSADNRIVASTSRMPTEAEVDKLSQLFNESGIGANVQAGPKYETDPMIWVFAGAAALIALGAAAIGTGLAAADGRADLSTLASVGASPRLRRGLSLSQAGVIAGLGSILGAGAGLGTAVAVLAATNQQYRDIWPGPIPLPIQVPWISLGVALLVVPAIALLGAGVLTRSRLPIERRI